MKEELTVNMVPWEIWEGDSEGRNSFCRNIGYEEIKLPGRDVWRSAKEMRQKCSGRRQG